MKYCAILLLSTTLVGCATPPMAPVNQLFNDRVFFAPAERINAADVLAVSDAMKHFLNTEIADQLRADGYQRGFIEALMTKGQLKLEYDSTMTRNASQAFDARAGNCLSLTIMAGALAKELGLAVRYQTVFVDETWGRSGDVYFSIGHVNLALGKRHIEGGFGRSDGDLMTIDFLPPEDVRTVRARIIGEETIVAMYMNNRAAESFILGQLNDAYWWARAAIVEDPGYLGSYNTLGVIYRRHGNVKEAEQVLAYALGREPENTRVMSNLAGTLDDLGQVAEARILTRKLEQLEPHPPFSYFNMGVKAMRDGNFKTARDLFAKEVDRAPYYHEFHFWLAVAYAALGETKLASEQLTIAIEYSTARNDRDLYAAKLDRIRSSNSR